MNEAELLFTDTLNYERQKLYLNADIILDSNQRHIISQALKRRIKGEPIRYILGKTEFMSLEFKVSKDVFIPRPETELLVETVINYANRLSPIANRILELGTGSGCIAISLAKYLSCFNITATDISEEALKVAEENARINNVDDKITFLRSNLFDSLTICDMRYAICVCNPPYISTKEIENLPPEVRYEPRIALDGGRDGLDFYRRIIIESPRYLRQNIFLIMEMGYKQKETIEKIFKKSDNFKIIDIIKDYSNIDRIIVAKRKASNG